MLQKMKNRLKDQRGLTLIELLAVIVILGIIAAIAVPSIMNVIDNSKEDAVKADAIQILNAGKLYVAAEGTPDENQIEWSELEDYVDLEGYTSALDVVANVDGSSITLTGTISKDGKTLNMNGASLSTIQGAEFDDNGVAGEPIETP